MPVKLNTCKDCGDGTEPEHELCRECERKQPAQNIPGDNWRAAGGRRRR